MKITVLATIALLFFAVIPVLAQDKSNADSAKDLSSIHPEKPNVVEKVSVNEVTPDDAIRQRLVKILDATEWFEDIEVDVRDSVAFLDGKTTDDDQREWAGRLARNTEDVAAVVNRIAVEKNVDFSGAFEVVTGSVKRLWEDFLARSPLILAGILALIVTGLVSRAAGFIVKRLSKSSGLRTNLQDLIHQLITIGIWTAGLLVTAVIMFPGMTPAKALTVLGLGSVAIGFAFKDIFENFFAGILILWKYPFDRGDFIESGNVHGRIEEITIRNTMIRQVDGQLVVVPNATLFKNPVDVLTDRSSRRTTLMCGVAYDTDLDKAREIMQEALESCKTVRNEHSVEIYAREFGDSSINFELTWWTGSKPLDIRKSQDEVVRSVKRALDNAGIEIPFPEQTLRLPDTIRTELAGRDSTE